MDAYNAVFELATAADTKHASQHLAAYPPAITRIDSGRDELILTLPAEDLQHAADQALALMKANGHRPTRFEVLLAEEYDGRDFLRTCNSRNVALLNSALLDQGLASLGSRRVSSLRCRPRRHVTNHLCPASSGRYANSVQGLLGTAAPAMTTCV